MLPLVQFETARGIRGTVLVSQISHGHKNHLTLELGGTEGSAGFDQERPDVLRSTIAPAVTSSIAAPRRCRPKHRRSVSCLQAIRRDSTTRLALFVAQAYDAIRHPDVKLSPSLGDGLPTFEDGAHAAAIVDAVLESARTRQWCDVGDRTGASSAIRTRDAGAVATGDGQPATDAGPAHHAAALQARGGRAQG